MEQSLAHREEQHDTTREQHDCTNPLRTEVKIEMPRLEQWFEHTAKKLADEARANDVSLFKSKTAKRNANSKLVFAAFASTLQEAVKVADDCGVCQTMQWFAGEYLSTVCENQRPDSPANEWLPWVEIGAMLSQLKSYALATH